jgi:hypothetical protein
MPPIFPMMLSVCVCLPSFASSVRVESHLAMDYSAACFAERKAPMRTAFAPTAKSDCCTIDTCPAQLLSIAPAPLPAGRLRT